MAGQAHQRASDLDTANQAPQVAPPVVANRAAGAGNAAMQERLKDKEPETGATGGEHSGSGQTTGTPGGGLPPADAINAKTPEHVLEQVLYAPSGKGRYRVVGNSLVPVEPGGVTAEQYEAAKKAMEEQEKKNDTRTTLKDTRADQNFDNPPRSMGEKGVEKSYTYGDQVTARTSKGRGDNVVLDYTREDGSQKQFQGG